MERIFISYSRKDIDFVRKLAGDLEKAGYDVWWDLTDLHGGDDWPRAIPAAIESSKYVIIVLSPNSTVSDWVEKEYTHALSLRKKIIPLMLVRSSIPFALNTINFIDFTSDDYVGNFNHLLTALGYTGEPPTVTPLTTLTTLPPRLRRYMIPIGIGMVLLLLIVVKRCVGPVPTPTPSPGTSTPAHLTLTPDVTSTESVTGTPAITSTATSTPSATTGTPAPTSTSIPVQAFSLPICVYIRDNGEAYIREGPGTSHYARLETTILANGTRCPLFSARIKNAEGIWFQFASDQEVEFKQFAGRWISAELLGAADLRWLPLPICIYTGDPGDAAEVREGPGENYDLQGDRLKADGTSCPFFDTRTENAEGTWYRFAAEQKEKYEDFKNYVGGWIRADFLAVKTLDLSPVTLTPTLTPTDTPTITPTFTRTPTPTPSNTPTITPTFTRTPTDTPTLMPTDTPIPTDTDTPTPTDTPITP
jgi:hypothetical protein